MFGVQMPFSQSKNCVAHIYQHRVVLRFSNNHQYLLLNYQNQISVPVLGTSKPSNHHSDSWRTSKEKVIFYEVVWILCKIWEPCLYTRTKCLISLVPQLYIRTRNLAFENHVYQPCKPPWFPVGGFSAVSTKPSNTVTYLQIHNYYQNTVLKHH
jgi:hypothetical protein